MKYTRLFTDSEGVSRFQDLELEFTSTDFAPPAPLLDVSTPTPAVAVMVLKMPKGWSDEMHPAPGRQWMYMLSGEASVMAGGETRRFLPGDAMLVEDTDGPGHASAAIVDSLIAIVRL